MADTSNFMLGKYIMLAVNDPKKYPREPVSVKSAEENDGKEMTLEDEAKINALLGAFAQKTDKLPSADEKAQEQAKFEASGP